MLTLRYSKFLQNKCVRLTSDASESMSERSPSDIANNNGLILTTLASFLVSLTLFLFFVCFRKDALWFRYGIFLEAAPFTYHLCCIVSAFSDGPSPENGFDASNLVNIYTIFIVPLRSVTLR